MRTLWVHSVLVKTTLQQLLVCRWSDMDAVKTLWEHRLDAVGTLGGRRIHALTGKFDIFRRISRRPHSTLTGFENAVQTLWHRHLVWQGLNSLLMNTQLKCVWVGCYPMTMHCVFFFVIVLSKHSTESYFLPVYCQINIFKCLVASELSDRLHLLLCSQKKIGPSGRPSVRPSVCTSRIHVRPITSIFEVGFWNYFTKKITILRRHVLYSYYQKLTIHQWL